MIEFFRKIGRALYPPHNHNKSTRGHIVTLYKRQNTIIGGLVSLYVWQSLDTIIEFLRWVF